MNEKLQNSLAEVVQFLLTWAQETKTFVEAHPVTDTHYQSHDLGFVVIAEVTEQDYRTCLIDRGSPDDTPFFNPVWFYAIRED